MGAVLAMRVLYVHQHFSTRDGATATRSYEMAKALLAAGHEVTLVCGSYAQGDTGLTGPFVHGRRRGRVEGIAVVELALPYGNHLGLWRRSAVFARFALAAIGLALTEPCDVIFCSSTPLTAALPGMVRRWLRGTPFVFEVRDLWPALPQAMGVVTHPLPLWLLSALEWGAYRSAHRLIGLSPGIVAGIAARGIPAARIALVPNGCDLDLFSPATPAWRPEGLADGALLALYAGTHGRANGLDAVLDAAQVLQDRGRDDIRILLVGQGAEKPALQARAARLGLGNVLFLDPLPKARLAGLMAGADLGLQVLRHVPAFQFGTSPNKFFDYIAAGLPVLNSYPGWLAQMITEEDCGLVCPPDDPLAFAEALIAAADDRAALRRKGQRARALAERDFARAALAARWVDWVVGAARPAAPGPVTGAGPSAGTQA